MVQSTAKKENISIVDLEVFGMDPAADFEDDLDPDQAPDPSVVFCSKGNF